MYAAVGIPAQGDRDWDWVGIDVVGIGVGRSQRQKANEMLAEVDFGYCDATGVAFRSPTWCIQIDGSEFHISKISVFLIEYTIRC